MWTPEKLAEFVGEGLLGLEALAPWLGRSLPHPLSLHLAGLGSSRALTEDLPLRLRVTPEPMLDDREGPISCLTSCVTWDGFHREYRCQ